MPKRKEDKEDEVSVYEILVSSYEHRCILFQALKDLNISIYTAPSVLTDSMTKALKPITAGPPQEESLRNKPLYASMICWLRQVRDLYLAKKRVGESVKP